MNSEHHIIEQELNKLSRQIIIPSREVFRPVFDRVTKSKSNRSIYSRFSVGVHKVYTMSRIQKTWALSLATSIAVVLIVIIPTVSTQQQEIVSYQGEIISAEANLETASLEQEDATVEKIVEVSLGQLTVLGESHE